MSCKTPTTVTAPVAPGISPAQTKTTIVNPVLQLSNRATLLTLSALIVIVFTVTHFLHFYILQTTNHIFLFAIGSYLVFSTYFVCDYFLQKASSSYKSIADHRKFYVISNLVKSAACGGLTPIAAHVLYSAIIHDQWPDVVLKNLGVMYAIPDFVSLILVERMSFSTKMHHTLVQFFAIISCCNDYGQENCARLLVVFACFSSFAYLVNLLLASRFLGVPEQARRHLSLLALLIYSSCCFINWGFHLYYLHFLLSKNPYDLSIYVYILLACVIIYDDIVLQRWLCVNAQKATDEQKKTDEEKKDE